MQRKKKKNLFLLDDRPSRFLLDLAPKPEPEKKIKEVEKRPMAERFFGIAKKEEIEYANVPPKPSLRERIERLAVFAGFKILQKSFFSIGAAVIWGIKFLFLPFGFFYKKSGDSRDFAPKLKYSPLKNKFSFKSLLIFSAVLAVLVLPIKGLSYIKNVYDLKGRVLGASEEAAMEMKGAAQAAADLRFNQATEDFIQASNKFLDAKDEIKIISKILDIIGGVIPGQDAELARSADLILDAGRLSADIGSHLTAAFSTLSGEQKKSPRIIVDNFYSHTQIASRYATELEEKVAQIETENLPAEYQAEFKMLKEKAGLVRGSLEEIVTLLENIKIFLGFDYDKRYLLVFQNNSELRASGGFIGSYALVDFHDGEIKSLEIPGGGAYDTEAGLRRQITSPEALWLVNPLWHFWDANWWPDWPTTAKKLMWFYEKSDGPTVDGVISFTPTVLEDILSIIGPIDLTEKNGLVITAENFWQETQEIAETKPEIATSTAEIATSTAIVRHEPKKIIGDLMTAIIAELPKRLDKEKFIALAQSLENSLQEKQALFYFTDENLEQKTADYGWDGRQKNTAWDYLMVVNTNVAGGKTDRVIRETITHEAQVAWDGTVTDTVTIKREHTGEKSQKFTGVRNNDWLRVYVPLGSELLEASGFSQPETEFFRVPSANWEIDSDVELTEGRAKIDAESNTKIYFENNKTVFANWSQIDPGQTAVIILKYRLPFRIEKPIREDNLVNQIGSLLNPNQEDLAPYALLVQKQPGSQGSSFSSLLKLDPNFQSVWQYPSDLPVNSSGWQVSADLKTDKFWAIMTKVNQNLFYFN